MVGYSLFPCGDFTFVSLYITCPLKFLIEIIGWKIASLSSAKYVNNSILKWAAWKTWISGFLNTDETYKRTEFEVMKRISWLIFYKEPLKRVSSTLVKRLTQVHWWGWRFESRQDLMHFYRKNHMIQSRFVLGF